MNKFLLSRELASWSLTRPFIPEEFSGTYNKEACNPRAALALFRKMLGDLFVLAS